MNEHDLPLLQHECLNIPSMDKLHPAAPMTHAPKMLLLYGSLRER